MSNYLSHLVNCTNRIELACREIRESASQVAVGASQVAVGASTNSDNIQKLLVEMDGFAEGCDRGGNRRDAIQVRTWIKQIEKDGN
jgi:hypothetical protein